MPEIQINKHYNYSLQQRLRQNKKRTGVVEKRRGIRNGVVNQDFSKKDSQLGHGG